MKLKFDFLNKLKPEKVFLVLATVYSLLHIFLTPPFQSPDEQKHFYRAYQISTGQWFVKKTNNRLGGNVPASFIAAADSFYYLQWQPDNKTSFKMIKRVGSIPLNPKELTVKDNPYFSLYFPVVYFPQASSIYFGRLLNLHPITILYLTRFFTAFIWILAMYYVIKKIPIHKNLVLAVSLLPMSVFINMSVSADVTTNILLFLFLSCLLRFKFTLSKPTYLKLISLGILGLLVSLAKSAYMPFTLLIFLVPTIKFKSKIQHYTFLAAYFCSIGVVYLFWSKYINGLYTPYAAYNQLFRKGIELFSTVNMNEQMQYVLHHPFSFAKVLLHTFSKNFPDLIEQYIGRLGWLDTQLPSFAIVLGILLIILSFTHKDGNNVKRLSVNNRFLLVGVSVATLIMIFLSQYLVWTPVGGNEIFGLQGRYFIPVFPLILIGFGSLFSFFSNRQLTSIVAVTSIVLLTISAVVLYKRYFYAPVLQPQVITCDAEKISDKNEKMLFCNNALFGNADNRSSNMARSGQYSIKLDGNNRYGFTYRINGIRVGEKIKASVWYKGNEGNLILAGKNMNELYTGQNIPDSTDLSGWQRLTKSVTISKKIEDSEIIMYVYYTGQDSAYFDDINITYFHREYKSKNRH